MVTRMPPVSYVAACEKCGCATVNWPTPNPNCVFCEHEALIERRVRDKIADEIMSDPNFDTYSNYDWQSYFAEIARGDSDAE